MQWTFRADRPIYLQIAERIIEDISNSVLQVGAKLPNVRVFAANIGANPNAVSKAYQYLLDNKVLVFAAGEYVVMQPALSEQVQEETDKTEVMKRLCGDFIEKMSDLGLSKKEIITFLCDYMVEESKKSEKS